MGHMIRRVLLLGLLLTFAPTPAPPPPQAPEPAAAADMVAVVRPTPDDVGAAVGELVLRVSQDAIAARGRFTLALSGGSLPKVRLLLLSVETLLQELPLSPFLRKLTTVCVRLDPQQGTRGALGRRGLRQVARVLRRRALRAARARRQQLQSVQGGALRPRASDASWPLILQKRTRLTGARWLQVAIPAAQIHTIDASLSPEAAAVDYTAKLATVWGDEVRSRSLISVYVYVSGYRLTTRRETAAAALRPDPARHGSRRPHVLALPRPQAAQGGQALRGVHRGLAQAATAAHHAHLPGREQRRARTFVTVCVCACSGVCFGAEDSPPSSSSC